MAKTTTNKQEKLKDKKEIARLEAENFKQKVVQVRSDTRFGKQLGGFSDFIRTQGVVGLAVGLAIGTQAGATVKSIVEGFINPMVSFLIGSQNGLVNSKWNVIGVDDSSANYLFTLGDRTLVIGWGAIMSSLITLVAVAAVIYFVVKGLGLDKLDKKKSEK